MPLPQFFLLADGVTVDCADTAPEGAILVDIRSEHPFWQRMITAAGLAVMMRLNAEWYASRWEEAPKGVRARFVGARFVGARFDGARFDGARFDGASFDGARFDGARFVGASFDGASFDGARFDGARFDGARFDGARFDGASFVGARFVGASFDGARFDGARFDGARFVGARFVGARFDGASFDGARFDGARFDGARFVGARFDGASFVGARFDGASFDGARFVGASTMPDGRTWDAYRADPLLGICDEPDARGRAVAAWDCHTWGNCPMHAAYGWRGIDEAPADKRIAVALFIALFDAKLLPRPTTSAPAVA